MRTRTFRLGAGFRLFALTAGLVVGGGVLLPAAAPAAPSAAACTPPPVYPIDQLQPGMTAYGLTVIQGTEPTRFDVTIIGVQPDGLGLGVDAIVVQGGSLIQQFGGFPMGVSGSPVYIGDRLVGAVSAIAYSDPSIGALTPAQPMLNLFGYPQSSAGTPPGTVMSGSATGTLRLSPELRAAAARAAGIPVGSFSPDMVAIPTPLGISGLSSQAFARLQAVLAKRAPNLVPYRAPSASAPTPGEATTTLQAGDSFAALQSYGDVTWGGVGTTTAACGDMLVAWGHPYSWRGNVTLGLSDADVLGVIPNRNAWVPMKLAYPTTPVGLVDQDRYAGLRGIQGALPAQVPIDSTIAEPDLGRSRTGQTELVDPTQAIYVVLSHFLANFETVADRWGEGTTALTWTIKGITPSGAAFTLRRTGMVYDKYEVGWAGSREVTYDVGMLLTDAFGTPTITSISATGSIVSRRVTATVERVLSASSVQPRLAERRQLLVRRGGWVKLRIELLPFGRTTVVPVDMTLRVPRSMPASAFLNVRGGRPPTEWCWEPGCGAEPIDASYEDMVARLAAQESANQLIASIGWGGTSVTTSSLREWIVQGKGWIKLVAR